MSFMYYNFMFLSTFHLAIFIYMSHMSNIQEAIFVCPLQGQVMGFAEAICRPQLYS
jgi:hypothetical protein